jgi:hypothetical protein
MNYRFICTILGLLLSLSVSARAQMITEEDMVRALKNSITAQERAWFEKQHDAYRAANPETKLVRNGHRVVFKGIDFPSAPRTAAASTAPTPVKRVLVLVNKTLYANPEVKERVDRYMQDIAAGHGCTVEIEELEGGSAVAIRDLLKSYYTNGGLDGAIQIGSLPVGWMEFKSDPFYGNYETWTCDHFYCDLDGQWVDADNNTYYDAHNPGSGDRGSEIFYARIDVKPMGSFGAEVQMCCDYLDKDHNYWTSGIEIKKSAIDLIEPDWNTSEQYLERVYGKANTKILRNPGAYSRNDYLNTHLKGEYSFLHLWCHSSNSAHSFANGGALNYTAVYNANPRPIGYAHDGCHLADWAAANNRGYLGGAYVFNKSPTALVCVAGTRTGQWIGLKGQRMFEEIGKNTCVGKAYQVWFDAYCNSSEMTRDIPYFMAWNYGMLILGDPMLTFITRMQTNVRELAHPSHSSGARSLNCSPVKSDGSCRIDWNIPRKDNTEISLFSLGGKKIATLADKAPCTGSKTIRLTHAGIPDGIYLLQARSDKVAAHTRITITR